MKVQQQSVIILCLIITSCLTLVSCSSNSAPDGYLSADAKNASYIQFTETNNNLTGHIQSVYETDDVPPQVKSFSIAFTGTHSGSSITISISIFGFSSSVTGTLNGNTLTLAFPQQDGHLKSETFNAGSLKDYNQAVDVVQKQVNKQDQQYYDNQATATAIQATQTAQQGQQQAVIDANSRLSSAMNVLKRDDNGLTSFSEASTLKSYDSAWQTMQNNYAKEQQDAQAGCGDGNYNYGTVQYDAGTVDYDYGTIQYDDGTLQYDKGTYDSLLSTYQSDVQAVKDAWTKLQQATADNTTNVPAAAYTQNDVNTVLKAAQSAENTAQGVWQSAQSSASQYDQKASALKQKADTLPSGMHC